MNTQVLEDLGLSKNEIAIFIDLSKSGQSNAGKIITSTNLQSSAVYNAINSLLKKGFISKIKKGNITYYQAAEPESIIGSIDLKKAEFKKILPELKRKESEDEKEDIEIFKGYSGIKTAMIDLLKNPKKGQIYRYIGEKAGNYLVARDHVYSAIKQIRKNLKISTRAIFPEETRHLVKPSKTSIKRFAKFPLPPNTQIYDDKVVITCWTKEPYAILIKSKEIYQRYADFFDYLWTISKK